MIHIPHELNAALRRHGQEHVLRWWDHLGSEQRRQLAEQLASTDLDLVGQLWREAAQGSRKVNSQQAPSSLEPIEAVHADALDHRTRFHGEEALRRGEVALLVVAGGQGTRLGATEPKGMFPIGPVSGKSLFQLHAEKVLALRQRHGRRVPWLIMTSPATDAKTREFFFRHAFFGLPPGDVTFFCQGTMPAVDAATGKLLLEDRDRLCLSPNGHGGVLPALDESGLLEQLHGHGFRHLFYFQVDNPLVKIADPHFLGHHLERRADVSTKAVPKTDPKEKVGNLVLADGRCSIIEYSDLPDELADARNVNGGLRFALGNTAIHLFDIEFLRRMARDRSSLPYHIARKKVPHVDVHGRRIEPEHTNALKFERFIFDILPRAERWAVVEINPEEEFAPLKNADGEYSPEQVQQAICRLAAKWLSGAGVALTGTDSAAPVVEISPLFALDREDLSGKVKPGLVIEGPTYLG